MQIRFQPPRAGGPLFEPRLAMITAPRVGVEHVLHVRLGHLACTHSRRADRGNESSGNCLICDSAVCLAAGSCAMGTSWSWRCSLERSQVAGCALPRLHGTHSYPAAVNRTRGYVDVSSAHPLITERESLIIETASASRGIPELLCARRGLNYARQVATRDAATRDV